MCHQVEIQPSTTSRMFKNVCKMFQNVPECMQNVPECSRMYEKYPECSSMFQTVCRVCQNVPKCMQNACRSMSLPAVTYACCRSMSLHAVSFYVWAAHKNFAVLVLTGFHITNNSWFRLGVNPYWVPCWEFEDILWVGGAMILSKFFWDLSVACD